MNTEQEMATPTQFLEDFTRDIVAHPEFRTQLMAGYARLMELREATLTLPKTKLTKEGLL